MAQQDLVHRLVTLAVRDRARNHRDRAAGIEPHHDRLALRLRGLLDDIGKADAAQLPAPAGLVATALERGVIRRGSHHADHHHGPHYKTKEKVSQSPRLIIGIPIAAIVWSWTIAGPIWRSR